MLTRPVPTTPTGRGARSSPPCPKEGSFWVIPDPVKVPPEFLLYESRVNWLHRLYREVPIGW